MTEGVAASATLQMLISGGSAPISGWLAWPLIIVAVAVLLWCCKVILELLK